MPENRYITLHCSPRWRLKSTGRIKERRFICDCVFIWYLQDCLHMFIYPSHILPHSITIRLGHVTRFRQWNISNVILYIILHYIILYIMYNIYNLYYNINVSCIKDHLDDLAWYVVHLSSVLEKKTTEIYDLFVIAKSGWFRSLSSSNFTCNVICVVIVHLIVHQHVLEWG